MDFTCKKYEQLVAQIADSEIPIYTVREWIAKKPDAGIVLRHDVDRKPKHALRIAQIEHKYGIRSVYYFRKLKFSFNTEVIQQTDAYGHEIGYHYEDLSLARGNPTKAGVLFREALETFRKLTRIDTVAMHGRPLSKYDNRKLWDHLSLKDFDLVGEAFLSIDYSDIWYFTDTGRTWSHKGANLRDKVDGIINKDIRTTDDLISFIRQNRTQKIALVTHPERWAANYFEYVTIYIKDSLINLIKRLIQVLRKS
jgi:hypothetical protein